MLDQVQGVAVSLHRVGVTPTVVRLAWHYAIKGVGTHYIEHSYFNNVKVETLYDWTSVNQVGRGGLRVNFRKGKEVIRYVELGVETIGAGGKPLVEIA